jgi:hypothetical protein
MDTKAPTVQFHCRSAKLLLWRGSQYALSALVGSKAGRGLNEVSDGFTQRLPVLKGGSSKTLFPRLILQLARYMLFS